MGLTPSMISTPCLPKEAGSSAQKGTDLDTGNVVDSLDSIRKQLEKIRLDTVQHIEPMADRTERYIRKLQVPIEHLKKMTESFIHELEVGLLAHRAHPHEWNAKECSFKMLDSCIPNLPTGKEKGTFFALDFGGSNFRVVRAKLTGDGNMDVAKYQKSVMDSEVSNLYPKGLMDSKATAMQMFDFFANCVKEFVEEQKDDSSEDVMMAGFTFSFPCTQRYINQAIVMNWTKGFETGLGTDDPILGLDAVELINAAFNRNNVPIFCNSVLNDTVGTLLSCSYSMDHTKHPPCVIGLILGTGMNCCYYDETAPQFGYRGRIINIESGNFNRDLPRLNVDCELDFKAVSNRGLQQNEKLCSGAYLGEICRLTLVRVMAERTPPMAWQAFSLSTEKLAQIIDDKSKELIVTFKIIAELWHVEMPLEHLTIVHRLATAVMDRAAALASVMIAACAHKSGRLQPAFGGLSCAIDGSLYKHNAWFRDRVRYHLNSILGNELGKLVHLLVADDGSGKGAAILAGTIGR